MPNYEEDTYSDSEDSSSSSSSSSDFETINDTSTIKLDTSTTKTEKEDSSSEDEDIELDEDEDDIKNIEDIEDIDIESEESEDSDSDNDSNSSDLEFKTETETEEENKKNKKNKKKKGESNKPLTLQSGGALSDDEDEDEDDAYLQKFNEDINKNYIVDNHPECVNVNFDEIIAMSKIIRDNKNNIVDHLHKTIPYLTKYERARILGQRAKQINSGMTSFVKVPENVIDGYLIAEMELVQKRIPFIIKRPIPGGGCEYWKVSDLELIGF